MPPSRLLSRVYSAIAAFLVNIQASRANAALATAVNSAILSPLLAPGRAANTVPFPCAGRRPRFPTIHTQRFTMRNHPLQARPMLFQTPMLLARPIGEAAVANRPVSLTGEAAPRSRLLAVCLRRIPDYHMANKVCSHFPFLFILIQYGQPC